MTKLVVVLAVVVVVILVVVIVAARNMRAEDPDEFDQPATRTRTRGGQGGRDQRYDRPERRPSSRPSGGGRPGRPAGRGPDQRIQNGRRTGADRDFGPRQARGLDDNGRPRMPPGPGQRRGDNGMAQMPTGQRRGSDNGMPVMPSAADDRRGAGNGRRPPTGPNQRRGSNGRPQRPDQGKAPARPRPARGKRSEDSSEWDSSEWDKLSDVDYWAELASEKPLASTKPAPQRRPERSRPDRETDVPASRRPTPGGAPRRDPATGLPVRGRPQPADTELAPAAAGLSDFAPAPVPVSGARAVKGLLELGDPGGPHTGPSDLPPLDRAIPPGAPRPFPDGPFPDGPVPDRAVPDNDPLTSPSFPRVPAADSRSYRSRRADTPPGGSRVPVPPPYPAPTQQFASYGSPAPQFSGQGGGAELTNPYTYTSDPSFQGPYAQAPSGPVGPVPTGPAPAAPAATGNPYGSYVTPDSQTVVSGYGGYPAPEYSAAEYQAPEYSGAAGNGMTPDSQTVVSSYDQYAGTGNGHGSYLPPAANGETGNDYWNQQATVPGVPGQDTPSYPDNSGSYPDNSGQFPDPLSPDGQGADYGNGYGQHDQAGYQPDAYPSGPPEQAGYAPLDPYGPDVYGSYPGYGAPGR